MQWKLRLFSCRILRITSEMKKHLFSLISVITVLGILVTGCNKDSDNSVEYIPTSNCAVTAFALQSNMKVLSHLDSVFFSIDLDKGLIFNAEPLPEGTDITALIPIISYPKTARGAVITMTGGKKRTGQTDYLKNPSDSIDFSGDVSFVLTAEDGVSVKEYKIKVNVYGFDPDSLQWDNTALSTLPSRAPSPRTQKTVAFSDKIYSLIEESDGSNTMSYTSLPSTGEWTKRKTDLSFVPDIRSFTATDNKLYILSSEGDLYESEDGQRWNSTDNNWNAILGGYGDHLLGIRQPSGGAMVHTRYPLDGYKETAIAEGFPVKGFTNMGVFSTKWARYPIALLYGGYNTSGKIQQSTWAYDGSTWANISEYKAVPLEGASLVPYFIYRKTSNIWIINEYSIWLLMGGRMADGSINREVYVSYDNGVNWRKGPVSMQLPEFIPGVCHADAVIFDTPMTDNIEPKAWKRMESPVRPGLRKLPFDMNGYDISWNCPCIYIFGGINGNGTLEDAVWKGVLNRMTLRPIF